MFSVAIIFLVQPVMTIKICKYTLIKGINRNQIKWSHEISDAITFMPSHYFTLVLIIFSRLIIQILTINKK